MTTTPPLPPLPDAVDDVRVMVRGEPDLVAAQDYYYTAEQMKSYATEYGRLCRESAVRDVDGADEYTPCAVTVYPATTFSAGCKLSTVIECIRSRAWPSPCPDVDMEAFGNAVNSIKQPNEITGSVSAEVAVPEDCGAREDYGMTFEEFWGLYRSENPGAFEQADELASLRQQLAEAQKYAARLNEIVNTPQADDFLRAVSTEAEHQRQRWGSNHDSGKTDADWFWLIGYLAGKALHSAMRGDATKAEHHIITTAAACANWHKASKGETNMRPGIDGDAAMARGDGNG